MNGWKHWIADVHDGMLRSEGNIRTTLVKKWVSSFEFQWSKWNDLVSGEEQEKSGGGGGNFFLDFFLRRRQLRLGCMDSSRVGVYSTHSLDEELVSADVGSCPELLQRCIICCCFFFWRCCWRALLVLRDLISHTSGSDSPPEFTIATLVSSFRQRETTESTWGSYFHSTLIGSNIDS